MLNSQSCLVITPLPHREGQGGWVFFYLFASLCAASVSVRGRGNV